MSDMTGWHMIIIVTRFYWYFLTWWISDFTMNQEARFAAATSLFCVEKASKGEKQEGKESSVTTRENEDLLKKRKEKYGAVYQWAIIDPLHWNSVSLLISPVCLSAVDRQNNLRRRMTRRINTPLKVNTAIRHTNAYVCFICFRTEAHPQRFSLLTESTAKLGATFSLISVNLSRNICLSSVAMMDSTDVPRTLTPCSCRMPRLNSSTPVQSMRYTSQLQ